MIHRAVTKGKVIPKKTSKYADENHGLNSKYQTGGKTPTRIRETRLPDKLGQAALEGSTELRRITTGKQIGSLTVTTPTKWSQKSGNSQKTPRDSKIDHQRIAHEEHLLKLEQERILKEQQEELQRIETEKEQQKTEIRNLRLKKIAYWLEDKIQDSKKVFSKTFLSALKVISK